MFLQRHKGVRNLRSSRTVLGRQSAEGETPVDERSETPVSTLSTTGHEESCGKQGRPLSKAKDLWRPIANKYREGKVKRTGLTGVK